MNESPIFARTHDLLLWLLQATRSFPREERFGMAQRLREKAFDLQDALIASVRDAAHAESHLLQADIDLTSLRKALLHSFQLGLLTAGQYRHVSQMDGDVGRLLGFMRTKKEGDTGKTNPPARR